MRNRRYRRRLTALAGGAALVLGAAAAGAAQAEDFYAYWGDGRAELSSYRVVQPRYGELREGYGVLIYVTEEINRRTLVKVETAQPAPDRVYTLKLNNTLNFLTGIYPYSVMTSVFSAVEGGPQEPGQPFEARKITLTSQEWCGHVFEEVQFRDGTIRGDLNSYFESEGKQAWQLERPRDFVSEDHLLIEIRELKGPYMAAGTTRAVRLLPALWQFRRHHTDRQLVDARLSKGEPESIEVRGQGYTAIRWTWTAGERETKAWVDTAWPRRILKWQDSEGGLGELVASVRLPYWQLNGSDDVGYREQLELPVTPPIGQP